MTDLASASLPSRARRALRRLGPGGFARLVALNVRLLLSGGYRDHGYAYDRSFDRQHGVDTAGTIAVEELDAASALKERAHRYEAADPGFFNFLVERLGLARHAEHLFIDVGAGKGRVMLLAAMAGFRRVTGLELDSRLARIARDNVALFRSRYPDVDFTVIEGDATAFAFPPVATVLFLNNPFDAQLMTRLVDAIERAHDGAGSDLAILYMHADHADLIRARAGWEEVDRGTFQTRRQFYSILRRRGGR